MLTRAVRGLIAATRALPPAAKAAAGGGLALVLAATLIAVTGDHRSGATAPGDVGAGSEQARGTSGAAEAHASDLLAPGAEDEARIEQDLAARAESLLSRVVGEGRVEVRVRAELDRSLREETRERYDPDGQVERVEERAPAAAGAGSERVEYDVGKQVTRTVTAAGAIARLHVAVLVDGKLPSGGLPPAQLSPWSPSELAQLETLARQAVGFSAERGDVLTLTSVPFETRGSWMGAGPLSALGSEAARTLLLLAAVITAAAVALRTIRRAPAMAGLPMPAAELEALLLHAARRDDASATLQPGVQVRDVRGSAQKARASDAAAATIRAWLEE